MKIKIRVLFLVFSFLMVGLTVAPPVTYALDYTLLEKIPGTANISGSDLPGYLSAIYKVALIVVTLSAVLMLSIGGFMYLTSAGNTSAIGTAKSIITDSLIGLVIALSAWLILYIINPDLVKITLQGLPPVSISVANLPPPSLEPISLPSGSDVDLAKRILVHPNITLVLRGTCKSADGEVSPTSSIKDIADGELADKCTAGCNGGAIGCLSGATKLSSKMLAAMIAVADVESYTVTSISGGPHASKSAHYEGRAIDIDTTGPENKAKAQRLLDLFVKALAIAPSSKSQGPPPSTWPGCVGLACGDGKAASMCESPSGDNVGCAPNTPADHVHIVFPN